MKVPLHMYPKKKEKDKLIAIDWRTSCKVTLMDKIPNIQIQVKEKIEKKKVRRMEK